MNLFNIDKLGYQVGTFKLGQKIYHIKDKEHKFKFHKRCEYCDSTGCVLIKGKKFTCPACKGEYMYKEVIEKIVDDSDIKIRSIITLRNKNNTYEYYTTNPDSLGLQIQRCADSINTYFETKEEAQEACEKFNKEHNVDLYLEEYNYVSNKERIRDEF